MIPVGQEEDTRKVQTAVLGGPDGHLPLFLPYEKQAADQLRQRHGSNAFTCGTLLGGCGKLLTLRACDDKKSHFAHRPPVRCTRTALGEDSADHLYIGEAVAEWLRSQGQSTVTVQYVRQKGARSDAIEVRFGSKKKRRLIHVQMARRSFKDWQTDGDRLRAPVGKPATIRMYGPESQLAAFEVDAAGHALRFECATENGTRVVYVGTHPPGHQVEWTTLDTCRLVPAGIVTPWLEETPYGIRPKGAGPAPRPESHAVDDRKAVTAQTPEVQGGGSVAGPVLPIMTGSVAFTGAALVSEEDDRRLYDAEAQPIGSARFAARISLPASIAAPVAHQVYVLTDRAAVLLGPGPALPDSRWRLRAEGFVRLTPAKAAEWEQLEPPAREKDATATAMATVPPAHIGEEQRTAVRGTRSSEPEPEPEPTGPADQAAGAPGLPPARPGEEPMERLQVILQHLEETEAKLPFPAFNRAVREADDLASLIGRPFLPTSVLQRLSQWRTVLRRRLEGPAVPDTPPREVFDRMADEFRAARDAGDLALARRVHSAMGTVYALRLSPQDREAVTGLMRAFKQWVREEESTTSANGSLDALRRILTDLETRQDALTAEEIADALTEADRIRRSLDAPLPEADDETLRRRRADLRHRMQAETGSGDDGLMSEVAGLSRGT
jgi:hypothetical protein